VRKAWIVVLLVLAAISFSHPATALTVQSKVGFDYNVSLTDWEFGAQEGGLLLLLENRIQENVTVVGVRIDGNDTLFNNGQSLRLSPGERDRWFRYVTNIETDIGFCEGYDYRIDVDILYETESGQSLVSKGTLSGLFSSGTDCPSSIGYLVANILLRLDLLIILVSLIGLLSILAVPAAFFFSDRGKLIFRPTRVNVIPSLFASILYFVSESIAIFPFIVRYNRYLDYTIFHFVFLFGIGMYTIISLIRDALMKTS